MKCIFRFLHADEDGKLQLVKKPFFEIPLSIMDIWYTQALMWYVFPLLATICIVVVPINMYLCLQAWVLL